jgi:hypothetical protein
MSIIGPPASRLHEKIPIILLGAFDRHNFGDLLFPHVATALLKEENLLYGGLAQRDLRCYGGHQVSSLAQLAKQFSGDPVHVCHAGGELLTCDAWEAAVMLLPPAAVQDTIARLDACPLEKLEWARGYLGISSLAPYIVSRGLFPRAVNIVCNAVGGVDFAMQSRAMQAELRDKLSQACEIAVRDQYTQSALDFAGIASRLLPDPAVMLAELFAEKIRHFAAAGETAKIRATYPQGYIAVQLSADFEDDRTLAQIAHQLDEFTQANTFGIVFFRAGAAPWHDDLDCYRRLVAQMQTSSVDVFCSLNIWDICALIAHSRIYCGSSLHGRIVAAAFARPRINIRPPGQQGRLTKHDAFVRTWEEPGTPGVVDAAQLAQGMHAALACEPERLRAKAAELVVRYRDGFDSLKMKLTGYSAGRAE